MISNAHRVIILIVTMYNFIPNGHYVIILIVTMYNFIPNSHHVKLRYIIEYGTGMELGFGRCMFSLLKFVVLVCLHVK